MFARQGHEALLVQPSTAKSCGSEQAWMMRTPSLPLENDWKVGIPSVFLILWGDIGFDSLFTWGR